MCAHLELQLLGNVTIHLDGVPVSGLRSRTAEALLIYVAAHRRPLSRTFLATFFWDERSDAQAGANLRAILSMLRKQFPEHLRITRQNVAFNHDSPSTVDADIFEQQLTEMAPSLRALAALDEEAMSRLEAALTLYRGGFAAGFYLSESRGFEEWALVRRERLRRLAAIGLQRLAKANLERGVFEKGAGHARRLLALDPLNEEGHRLLMWLLMRNGQRTEALHQYQLCRNLLADQLDVAPATATTALYRRLSRLPFPPPVHVPPAGTPFVGREAALATITGQVAKQTRRLLTILGPGGVGKTRLAQETARRLGQHRPGTFLDGIVYVPLEGIEGAERLPLVLAKALELPVHGREPVATQLLDYLQEREMLVILDNFEPLLADEGATAFPAMILRRAPGVTLLVTSRQRLRLQEEWVFDLHGLAYPPATTGMPVPDGECEAVRLFLQSVARVRHDFHPTPADLQAIARICAQLEGLPLGIELAASWMRHADSQAIAAVIEEGMHEMETTVRNVSTRHRSLRAVFEHSWRLLSRAEQAAAVRLVIFRGAFTPAASADIAGCSHALLASLADKSMVQQTEDRRYRLHGAIRPFLQEKANARQEEMGPGRTAHAAYYLKLVAEQEPALSGADHRNARQMLLAELEDIRAAWLRAAETGDSPALERALTGLFAFYDKQNWFEEGADLFARAAAGLRRQRATPRNRFLQARLRMRRARFALSGADYAVADRLLVEGMAELEALSTMGAGIPAATVAHERAHSLGYLGVSAARQGAYAEATAYGEEGLAVARRLEAPKIIAFCLNLLANLALYRGDYAEARGLQEENLRLRREGGDRYGEGLALNNLGSIAQAQGAYTEAKELYELCYEVFQEDDYRRGMAAALTNAGYVAWKQGALDEAAELHQQSVKLNRELDDRRGEAVALANLGETALSAGRYGRAARCFEDGLTLALAIEAVPLVLDLLAGVADWLLTTGREEEALPLLAVVARERATTQETRERAARLQQVALTALSGVGASSRTVEVISWKEAARMALAALAG